MACGTHLSRSLVQTKDTRGIVSAVRRPPPAARRPQPLLWDRSRGPERKPTLCYRGGIVRSSFRKERDRLASTSRKRRRTVILGVAIDWP
eukprot:scaffold293_cov375-Pavlova_lutheri.AAC.2